MAHFRGVRLSAMRGRLCASRRHRDRVSCELPLSRASCLGDRRGHDRGGDARQVRALGRRPERRRRPRRPIQAVPGRHLRRGSRGADRGLRHGRALINRARDRPERSPAQAPAELPIARASARPAWSRRSGTRPGYRHGAAAPRARIGDRPARPPGCVGVVTDAKPHAVRCYEELGFRALEGVREGLLVSEPLPLFLGIDPIAATISPR